MIYQIRLGLTLSIGLHRIGDNALMDFQRPRSPISDFIQKKKAFYFANGKAKI